MLFDWKRKDPYKGLEKFSQDPNGILVDVRIPEEYHLKHLDGVINIPLADIKNFQKYNDKHWYVYCLDGFRAEIAMYRLRNKGIPATNIGGIARYRFNS